MRAHKVEDDSLQNLRPFYGEWDKDFTKSLKLPRK